MAAKASAFRPPYQQGNIADSAPAASANYGSIPLVYRVDGSGTPTSPALSPALPDRRAARYGPLGVRGRGSDRSLGAGASARPRCGSRRQQAHLAAQLDELRAVFPMASTCRGPIPFPSPTDDLARYA
jgi:hypothetical protein